MGLTDSDSPWQPTKDDLPEDNLQRLGISFAEIEQNPVFLIITKREKEKAAGRTLRTLLFFGVMVIGTFTPLLTVYPVFFLLVVFRYPLPLFTGPFRCVSTVGISDSLTREDIARLLDTPLTPEDYAIGTLGAILSQRNVQWTQRAYFILEIASMITLLFYIWKLKSISSMFFGIIQVAGFIGAVTTIWFCAAQIVSIRCLAECAMADLVKRIRRRLHAPNVLEDSIDEKRDPSSTPMINYFLASFFGLLLMIAISPSLDSALNNDDFRSFTLFLSLQAIIFGLLAGYLRAKPARNFANFKWARLMKSYELYLDSMR